MRVDWNRSSVHQCYRHIWGLDRCKTKAIQTVSDICKVGKLFTWHVLADYIVGSNNRLVIYTDVYINSDMKSHWWFCPRLVYLIQLIKARGQYVYIRSCLLVQIRDIRSNKCDWCVYLLCSQMLVIPWTRAHPLQWRQLLSPVPVFIQRRITGSSRHLGHIPHADETNLITLSPDHSLLIICSICHSRNDHDVLKRLMANSYHWFERRTREPSYSV